MDRRKLILRRFGALTFGLGYFEDGVWVDHLAAPAAETDDPAIAAIHAALDCCGNRAPDLTAVFAVAVDVASPNGATREPIAVAGRSATS